MIFYSLIENKCLGLAYNSFTLFIVAGIVIVAIPIYIAIDTKRHFYITFLYIDYFLFITAKFLSVANIIYHNVKVYDLRSIVVFVYVRK